MSETWKIHRKSKLHIARLTVWRLGTEVLWMKRVTSTWVHEGWLSQRWNMVPPSLPPQFLSRGAVSWHDRNRYKPCDQIRCHTQQSHTRLSTFFEGVTGLMCERLPLLCEGEFWEEAELINPCLPLIPQPSTISFSPNHRHLLTWNQPVNFSQSRLPFLPLPSLMVVLALPTLKPPPLQPPRSGHSCASFVSHRKKEGELWLTIADWEQTFFVCGDWDGECETHSFLLLRKLSTWLRSCMSHYLFSLRLIYFSAGHFPLCFHCWLLPQSIANMNSRCSKPHPTPHPALRCHSFQTTPNFLNPLLFEPLVRSSSALYL